MKKLIVATIDTETVGGATNPTGAYNYGCVIHDREGNILATTSLLVMEHYDEIANDDYAKKNFPIYRERLDAGLISAVATEEEAVAIIRNLCRHYGVRYVTAYNSGFDFVKTKCAELLDEFEFIDIYLMALQTVCHLKGYGAFCREHEMWSKSGKTCATSAESLYAFITGNCEYEEEHTALSDALIEKDIFVRCVKTHKKYVKNCHQFDYRGEVKKCFPPRKVKPKKKA